MTLSFGAFDFKESLIFWKSAHRINIFWGLGFIVSIKFGYP